MTRTTHIPMLTLLAAALAAPQALGQDAAIRDSQRLQLQQATEFASTQARIVESRVQPMAQSMSKLKEAASEMRNGNRNTAIELVRQATTLFDEAAPGVDHAMRSYGGNLMVIYGSTFGDAGLDEEHRERLEVAAREAAGKMQSAQATGDEFLARIWKIRLFSVYLDSRGLQGSLPSEEAVQRLRDRLESAFIENETRIVELHQARQLMDAMSMIAVAESGGLGLDLQGLSDIEFVQGLFDEFIEATADPDADGPSPIGGMDSPAFDAFLQHAIATE